jgi:hypothetical protein
MKPDRPPLAVPHGYFFFGGGGDALSSEQSTIE